MGRHWSIGGTLSPCFCILFVFGDYLYICVLFVYFLYILVYFAVCKCANSWGATGQEVAAWVPVICWMQNCTFDLKNMHSAMYKWVNSWSTIQEVHEIMLIIKSIKLSMCKCAQLWPALVKGYVSPCKRKDMYKFVKKRVHRVLWVNM